LLNRACRFFPIVRILKETVPADARVLEVGSGSIGLGEYWKGSFTGCDISFSSRPVSNMVAIRCAGEHLPFRDQSFDAVVVSDVMEHVPPPLRRALLSEALRVCRRIVVIGYPCGPAAFGIDEELYSAYGDKKRTPPLWLQEHMLHPFPDEDLITQLPNGWRKVVIPNETLRFHAWLSKMEMSRTLNYSFRFLLRVVPGVIDRILQHVNQEPSYRKIFVLTQEEQRHYA